MVIDKDNNLFWVDLEMTGLNPEEHVILEIACLITDKELNIIAEGPELVIHQSEEQLNKIIDDVKDVLQKDLIDKVRISDITSEDAEEKILNFVKEYCNPKISPFCGNTVSTDKQFIKKFMPKLADYLHYRLIDVSTIKELSKRWYPHIPGYEKPNKHHRAMDDIKESVAELKYYKEKIFIPLTP